MRKYNMMYTDRWHAARTRGCQLSQATGEHLSHDRSAPRIIGMRTNLIAADLSHEPCQPVRGSGGEVKVSICERTRKKVASTNTQRTDPCGIIKPQKVIGLLAEPPMLRTTGNEEPSAVIWQPSKPCTVAFGSGPQRKGSGWGAVRLNIVVLWGVSGHEYYRQPPMDAGMLTGISVAEMGGTVVLYDKE